jgi:ketosteroid isomerase-like protein
MSQENVDTLRALWPSEAVDLVGVFSELDAVPSFLSAISADAEVVFGPGDPAVNRTYRGLQGLAAGWQDWLEPYEAYWLKVERYVNGPQERVVMLAKVRARTRRDGVLIEHSPAAVCELSNGTVTRLAFYLDRDEALEAAGLTA